MASGKYIVITSINAPGETISGFCKWGGWQVVVIGDAKTPKNWHHDGVTYLGIEQQHDLFPELAQAIPENTYTRKMIGYAYAIQRGATAIFESDDDNIPFPDSDKTVEGMLQEDRSAGGRCRSNGLWLNSYRLFGSAGCWPRGFPLECVESPSCEARFGMDDKPWAIIQFLADNDPDVDAIYRMRDGRAVHFARNQRFIFDERTYCPINSQATLWTPGAFPLIFLPLGVTDRVTDILRGYIATACLWKSGYSVAFASPVVSQERNVHDLNTDFMQEMALYVHADAWCRRLLGIEGDNMIDRYRSAIKKLAEMRAVPEQNLIIYDKFLRAAGMTT